VLRIFRWSAYRLRTKSLVVIALPVLPLAFFWLITALAMLQRDVPENTPTRDLIVQAGLARVLGALLDADAGARDNLLTDNAAALARCQAAIDRLPPVLAQLNNAVIDPKLRDSLATLNGVIDDELAVLSRLTGGPPAAGPKLGERAALDRSAANIARVRTLSTAIERGQSSLAQARAAAIERARRANFLILLVGSIVCVGGGVVAAVLKANGLTRRILRLSRNADRLAQGEPLEAVPPGEDEIGQLEVRFRDAARLLHEREDALRESSQLLARDVTYQRQLHVALQARTHELEAANRELESFSYSVSHDLRAPLRAIDGFSQTIEEDCADRLDDAGRDSLRRVRAAARRMGTLIDEMLNLSRLSRTELRRERLDLGVAAASILADLARSGQGRHVEVRIDRDLVADADPQLVRIALENLLDNAWKYTSKTQRALIEVGSSPNGAARTFYVRDNGAGFDMTYSSKLFGAFQRLHSPQEFDGTGVGLATVQRIVHRHGGKIWADGAVNAGATFYFTLEPEDGRHP
jgi:signal transduction histidine kinase